MMKLLLDANLSPETAEYLRRVFSFNAASLIELGKSALKDQEVVRLAQQEKRIIITMDLDFGELYHSAMAAELFGIIVLRLRDQRVEKVNQVLNRFFLDKKAKALLKQKPHPLVVLDESSIRVR